jgi:uncharacterized protein (DUF1501 family)
MTRVRSTRLLSRREMIRRSAAALSIAAVHTALPVWTPRLAFAPAQTSPRGDVLISVFLRGGADALNMIIPHGDNRYYQARPTLAIPRPDSRAEDRVIDLDGFFGLHPALGTLAPAFTAGEMVAIHSTGSPHESRSHFEAMDYMERGTPGNYGMSTGWIGRHLATLDTGNLAPIRALGWGAAVQAALRGAPIPLAMKSIVDYHLNGDARVAAQMLAALEQLYALEGGSLHEAAQATQSAYQIFSSIDYENYNARHEARYPATTFARALKQTAALIRADVGLEAACIDLGGWDTHANQGTSDGNQARAMRELADGLAAFYTDMGPQMASITVLVMSEFGRRVAENSGRGTDHGHGGAMMVMSGNLARGPVVANWLGLQPEFLNRGEDLEITTDYRDVLSETLTRRLNNPNIATIFPDYAPGSLALYR